MKFLAASLALAAVSSSASAAMIKSLPTRQSGPPPDVYISEFEIKCISDKTRCIYDFGLGSTDDDKSPSLPVLCGTFESSSNGAIPDVEDAGCARSDWTWSTRHDRGNGDIHLTFVSGGGVRYCHKLPGKDFVVKEKDGTEYERYSGPRKFKGSIKDC